MFESIHESTRLWICVSLSLLTIAQLSVRSQQTTDTPNTTWSCEQLDFCSDRLGFEAIEWLFRQLDDDSDGNVDITESNEFLRDELKYENGYERQKAFHGNDKQITVDELWKAWKSSAVRNWTVDETVEWLINTVELPQYVEHFQHNAVDGMALPRLAANTQFISILGINNPIHKQKLALKAMDVVLFGAPKHHNFVKDVILAVALIIAIGGVWFAYVQHKSSQSHLKKMLKDMDTLQKAEEQLMGLQQELDKIREEQQIVFKEKTNLEKKLTEKSASYTGLTDVARIIELEDELSRLREELKRAQTTHANRWTAPHNLQLWLQLTHELEIRSFNSKRMAAESQLYAAKDGCEKLRKKRATLLGAFRVAHGSSIDDVDSRILQAKTALSEVTKDLQERLHRWRQIEMYCGIPVIQNPGLEYLQTVLYGSPVSGPPGALPSIGLSRVGSETSIDEDERRVLSGSIANVSITGFGLSLPSDKTSLLSINNNNTNRKHSNGTMHSNNSTVGDQSEDDFDEGDVVSLSSMRVNPSFSIGNSTIKEELKPLNPNESKAFNRSKMFQKSYSEDQDSSRLRYERSDTIEVDSICHSESCNELQSSASTQRSATSSDSISRETNISEKISSNATQIAKSMDELENTSNDSNSLKDFDNKTSLSTEKKRSLFHGLRKRKTPKT